jgi:hypothetical protein
MALKYYYGPFMFSKSDTKSDTVKEPDYVDPKGKIL